MPATLESLTDTFEQLVRRAARSIAPDVRAALEQAVVTEPDETAKGVLETLLAKAANAKEAGHALASDTGIVTFFVRVGCDFQQLDGLCDSLREAVVRATKHEPLSEFVVDLKTGAPKKGNVGIGVPVLHTEIVTGSAECEVLVLLKGAGSEQLTTLWDLPASTTPQDVGQRLHDLILEAGGKPCPPLIVGVGMGGTPEQALMLSRIALSRKVGEVNPDPTVAAWESTWRTHINGSGIGPMGLGGETTVLAVHAEVADRHRAFCPVGVSVACWSDRHASVRIDADGVAHPGWK